MTVALPRVTVTASAGEAPTVTVDGHVLPAVRDAQVIVTDGGVPTLLLRLPAAALDVSLPAGVVVQRTGATAAEFAAHLDPARLESDAADMAGEDLTAGEVFAAAVARQAAEWDDVDD